MCHDTVSSLLMLYGGGVELGSIISASAWEEAARAESWEHNLRQESNWDDVLTFSLEYGMVIKYKPFQSNTLQHLPTFN